MIRVRHDGPIAILALDRPEARNALAIADWEALAEATRTLGEARAVILHSDVPGIFSAGADIPGFAALQADPALRTRFRTAMRAAIDAVAGVPVPVIAAIDGGCFGAAVALALAADIRIGGNDARFAVPPAKLGLGYPREDVARLAEQVGTGAAALLLFSGDAIDAAEAHRIGLLERQVALAEPAAMALAQGIAANAPLAVRLLKRTLADPRDTSLDAAFEASFGGGEFAEGLAAFRTKRSPIYR